MAEKDNGSDDASKVSELGPGQLSFISEVDMNRSEVILDDTRSDSTHMTSPSLIDPPPKTERAGSMFSQYSDHGSVGWEIMMRQMEARMAAKEKEEKEEKEARRAAKEKEEKEEKEARKAAKEKKEEEKEARMAAKEQREKEEKEKEKQKEKEEKEVRRAEKEKERQLEITKINENAEKFNTNILKAISDLVDKLERKNLKKVCVEQNQENSALGKVEDVLVENVKNTEKDCLELQENVGGNCGLLVVKEFQKDEEVKEFHKDAVEGFEEFHNDDEEVEEIKVFQEVKDAVIAVEHSECRSVIDEVDVCLPLMQREVIEEVKLINENQDEFEEVVIENEIQESAVKHKIEEFAVQKECCVESQNEFRTTSLQVRDRETETEVESLPESETEKQVKQENHNYTLNTDYDETDNDSWQLHLLESISRRKTQDVVADGKVSFPFDRGRYFARV